MSFNLIQNTDDYPLDEEEARDLGVDQETDPLYDKDSDEKDAKWVANRYSTGF